MNMTAKTAATILGIVFVAVGILGFIPNPLVSPTGLFAVNTAHNLVHLVSGAALLAGDSKPLKLVEWANVDPGTTEGQRRQADRIERKCPYDRERG